MRINYRIGVFVTAVLVGHLSVNAQQQPTQLSPVPDDQSAIYDRSNDAARPDYTGSNRLTRPSDPFFFNGFSVFRQTPDLGAPGSAGHGFKHFMLPMDKYTTWYRPRAATLNQCQRCAPDSFRPRGYGHMFAEPCDSFRMEYAPYELHDGQALYGPAYIARQPDPRCDNCDHTTKHHHHN
jgi:hypothetical protein